MPYPITSFNISTSGFRYIPIDWAPRWINAYQDINSPLRKFLFSACYYHLSQALQKSSPYVRPAFFGAESQLSYVFLGLLSETISEFSQISINTPYTSVPASTVYRANDFGSFLHENVYPVYWYEPGSPIYFRNIDIVSYTVRAVSGILDLSVELSEHPILEDSYFVLLNEWGDEELIDKTNLRIANNTIRVMSDGLFTVLWQSSVLNQYALTASGYIHQNGEPIPLSYQPINNVWDTTCGLYGIKRKDFEQNSTIKSRYQRYSLSNKIETLIGSVLGQSSVLLWNPQDSWSLAGSGSTYIAPVKISEREYKTENPIKWENRFLLSQSVSGVININLRGLPQDPGSYIVSGNVIVPLTSQLLNAEGNELTVTYKVLNYGTTVSSGYYLSIYPASSSPGLEYVVVTKNLRINSTTKRIKSRSWGSRSNYHSGNSEFN